MSTPIHQAGQDISHAAHDVAHAAGEVGEAAGHAAQAAKPVVERVWDAGNRIVSVITSVGLMGTVSYLASIASQIGATWLSAYANSLGAVEAARSLGSFAFAAANVNSLLLPLATPLFMIALAGIAYHGVKGLTYAGSGFHTGLDLKTGFVQPNPAQPVRV